MLLKITENKIQFKLKPFVMKYNISCHKEENYEKS